MNLRLVFKITGKTLLVECVLMLLPVLVALLCRESPRPMLFSILITAAAGFCLSRFRPSRTGFFARDGLAAVAVIWLFTSLFGALPFYFSGYFPSAVDCLFESISGFTTTGATILAAVEELPKGILFWRSFTQWIGGMGVLILTLALLPSLGARAHYLMDAENPGPQSSKLVPKSGQSSKILYAIYVVLSALEAAALLIAGFPLYDAVVTTFTTAGTGGFSVRNLSIASYGNPAAEIIISIFMILFSINFTVFFLMIGGKIRSALRSEELRLYLSIIAVSVFLVTLNVSPLYGSTGKALRHSFFQVASILSTSGFAITDYSLWPELSKILLIGLMLCGSCAGSTGGGIKVSRILMLFKDFSREIRKSIHPRSYQVIKIDGHIVEEATLKGVSVYLSVYVFLFLFASLIVSLDNFPFTSTVTGVIASLSNIGPGLESIGPTGNYSAFSDLSKITLSFCMLIGRLEFFPVLILFSRNAWRRR